MVGDLAAAVALDDLDAARGEPRRRGEDVARRGVPAQRVDVRVLEEQQPLVPLSPSPRLTASRAASCSANASAYGTRPRKLQRVRRGGDDAGDPNIASFYAGVSRRLGAEGVLR